MTRRLGSLTAVWVLSGDAVWTHDCCLGGGRDLRGLASVVPYWIGRAEHRSGGREALVAGRRTALGLIRCPTEHESADALRSRIHKPIATGFPFYRRNRASDRHGVAERISGVAAPPGHHIHIDESSFMISEKTDRRPAGPLVGTNQIRCTPATTVESYSVRVGIGGGVDILGRNEFSDGKPR